MGDTDDRKPLTPAELIAQLERSSIIAIAPALANDAHMTLRERLLLGLGCVLAPRRSRCNEARRRPRRIPLYGGHMLFAAPHGLRVCIVPATLIE